jgi:hypothetical protein
MYCAASSDQVDGVARAALVWADENHWIIVEGSKGCAGACYGGNGTYWCYEECYDLERNW